MEDAFALPVSYGGEDLEFPLRILPGGYSLRYVVEVDGLELVYEQDDAGELRATIRDAEADAAAKPPEPRLLAAIGAVIQQLMG